MVRPIACPTPCPPQLGRAVGSWGDDARGWRGDRAGVDLGRGRSLEVILTVDDTVVYP